MSKLRLYLDENVDPSVAEQLRRNGIDAVHVIDLDLLGGADVNHLVKATEMERVLCTHDQDFFALAIENPDHAGIVFAHHNSTTIGDWVRGLGRLHSERTAEEMSGIFIFLPT